MINQDNINAVVSAMKYAQTTWGDLNLIGGYNERNERNFW